MSDVCGVVGTGTAYIGITLLLSRVAADVMVVTLFTLSRGMCTAFGETKSHFKSQNTDLRIPLCLCISLTGALHG